MVGLDSISARCALVPKQFAAQGPASDKQLPAMRISYDDSSRETLIGTVNI